MSKIAKLTGLVMMIALSLTGCSSQMDEKETAESNEAVSEPQQEVEAEPTLSESEDEYVNAAFDYKFVIPAGVNVVTQGVVMYPVEHEKAIELMIDFGDGETAYFSAMREPETFPELKGREELSAQGYIEAWWNDNKTETNPYAEPVLSPIFSKNINGLDWYGFTVDELLTSANNTGGGLLEEPVMVMVTKKGTTFYRWYFKANVADAVEDLLLGFEVQ
jgi:hypothetical protein